MFNQLSNVEDTIIWCAKRGLIKNFIECEKCNRLCTLHTVDTLSDGVIWRCSTCYFKCTIRKNSLFEDSNVQLIILMYVLYFWSTEALQCNVTHELELSEVTVSTWYQKLREVCGWLTENNPQELGGQTEDNEIT